MHQIVLLTLIFFCPLLNASIEDALILLNKDKQKAIDILEVEYDRAENSNKRGQIAFLISLDPSTKIKTKKSMTYYIQNALLNYKKLEEKERYRLYRFLAELSFKKGDLKLALINYDRVLSKKEYISGIEDYLTLQKSWVYINLDKYSKAINTLEGYLIKKEGKLDALMFHDLGKFYAENLFKKNNKSRDIHKSLIVRSVDFYAGLYAGYKRSHGDLKVISSYLKKNGHYSAFYEFAIGENKFESINSCDYLNWTIPKMVNEETALLLVKKSYGCTKRKKEVKHLAQSLFKQKHRFIELALLEEKIKGMNVCEIALGTLEKKIVSPDILKISMSHCFNSKYKDKFFSILDSIQGSDVKLPRVAQIIYIDSIRKEKDLGEKLWKEITEVYSKYVNSQKSVIIHMALNDNRYDLAQKWINEDIKLIRVKGLYLKVIAEQEGLQQVKGDPVLNFLRGSEKVSESYLIMVKKLLPKSVYNNISMFNELDKLSSQNHRLHTLERQDKFFFKLKRIISRLEKHKWLNIELKDRYLAQLKTILSASKMIVANNRTQISDTLENVLNKWEMSL